MAAHVVGIGAPLCDYLLPVKRDFLSSVSGLKEGMERVDLETFYTLIAKSGQSPSVVAGGSCCNTLKGLAKLGWSTALLGSIGEDEIADIAVQSLRSYGVVPLLSQSASPTARVLCLIDPDGNRTFRSFFGASAELTETTFPSKKLGKPFLVHLEGYLILNGLLVECAMEAAVKSGARISYDLGSHELVAAHRTRLQALIERFVTVLFCNRDEMRALTGLGPEEGCAQMRRFCPLVVVLNGAQGCVVGDKNGQYVFPAHSVHPLDTTGAGDLFASGFLHGYLSEMPLRVCAELGLLLSSTVIQVLGAEISAEGWEEIFLKIKKIFVEKGEKTQRGA